MKTRTGFVSNSSSTSFVIRSDQKEKAKIQGLELYKVQDLINKLQPLKDLLSNISNGIPLFLMDHLWIDTGICQSLIDLEKRYPGCFITAPFDRDAAYERGMRYPIFEGDL